MKGTQTATRASPAAPATRMGYSVLGHVSHSRTWPPAYLLALTPRSKGAIMVTRAPGGGQEAAGEHRASEQGKGEKRVDGLGT